jgi:RNA polymerase sigma-70 factor (ECF subfamily)
MWSRKNRTVPNPGTDRNDLYQQATAAYGRAFERLARAYEADPDRRQDLLQEIHLEVWKSLEVYESRCALRTWVYRVAHNTAAKHVIRRMRTKPEVLVGLEEIPERPAGSGNEKTKQLMELIHLLKPPDRQLMLLYLEGVETESIAEIIGLSAGNVRTKIHRLKAILARQFHEGGKA